MKDGFEPQSKSFQFSSLKGKEFLEKQGEAGTGVNWKGGPDFFTQKEFTLFFELGTKEANHQQLQQIDRTWFAVIKTFDEMNLPIKTKKKTSGLISTDWISFTGQNDETGYCDCGTTKFPLSEVDRRGKISVSIILTENSVETKVEAVFEKISQYKEIVDNTPCVSNGNLEVEIRKRISEKIL